MDLKNYKFKDYFFTFLKGMVLGLVSMGIPGLSASTVGIIFGIYFLMVESISNFFKDIKHNFSFLIFLIGGYSAGALLAAFSVTILFDKFPLVTTLVVLGMILGSLPDLFLKLRKDFKKASGWISMLVVLVLILTYNFLITNGDTQQFPDNPSWGYLIKMIFIGAVTSATFIVPGVDFAVVFLSLGLYYPFMNMIADLMSFGSPEYMTYFIGYIKILGFYLIGYFIGMFIFSKIIKFLLGKYKSQTEFASLAFVVAAPAIVIKNCIFDNESFFYTTPQMVVGLILGIISLVLLVLLAVKTYKKRTLYESLSNENNIINEENALPE